MNSKQLAHVLIKVLGLWVCLQAIPGFVSGFLRGFISAWHRSDGVGASSVSLYAWTSAVGAAVYLCVGILLVCRSRFVADKLFGNEE
jgi:hypothetical protein